MSDGEWRRIRGWGTHAAMSRSRAVLPFVSTILAVAVAVGCDDPAPNKPAAPIGSTPTASSTPAPAVSSAAPSASVSAPPAPEASTAEAPPVAPPASADAPPPALSGQAAVPPKPAATPGTPHTGILKAAEADKILKKGSPTRVTLVDAGADPKSPMRYALATGATTGIEMGLSMTLEVAQGERTAPPQTIPRIATLLELVSASAPKGGALPIDATIKKVSIAPDAGVPQQIADRLLPHLQAIEGLGLHYEVTPEGRVKQAGAKMPDAKKNPALDGTLTQMTQSLESMIAPFPEEPIGIGAKWQVVSRFDSSGTELVQWSTFQLRERDEGGAKLALEVVQAAAHAEVTPPNLPAGVSAKLTEFASTGKGESSVDFAYPAPRTATMTVDSKMVLAVQQGTTAGPPTSMRSKMVVDMKQSKGAAPKAPAKP